MFIFRYSNFQLARFSTSCLVSEYHPEGKQTRLKFNFKRGRNSFIARALCNLISSTSHILKGVVSSIVKCHGQMKLKNPTNVMRDFGVCCYCVEYTPAWPWKFLKLEMFDEKFKMRRRSINCWQLIELNRMWENERMAGIHSCQRNYFRNSLTDGIKEGSIKKALTTKNFSFLNYFTCNTFFTSMAQKERNSEGHQSDITLQLLWEV